MDPLIIQHYKDYNNVYYTGNLGLYENWTHRALERTPKGKSFAKVLDVGGGDGQHVPYLKLEVEQYTILDLLDHSENMNVKISSSMLEKVVFLVGNAEALPFPDDSFDRVIATCVLHHLDNPAAALAEWRRVVKDQGVISIYIPNDPGMIYRWVRHFASHRKYAKKTNRSVAEIKHLWALEHKNHVLGLMTLVKQTFNNDEIKKRRYPFPWFSWNINLFVTYQIIVKKK
jgi:phosphatidylethanolamine/phosphatidyl-N-methylethanolamine N-methyltransferase